MPRGSEELVGINTVFRQQPTFPLLTDELPPWGGPPMSPTNRRPLDQLLELRRSSSEFPDRVSNILYGWEYQQWVKATLKDDVVQELVDWLDEVRCRISYLRVILKPLQALDALDPASSAARKCMQELRHICGARKKLPASSTFSFQVSLNSYQSVASGGSGDVYEGTLNNSRVCVKRIRVYAKDSSGEPPDVRHIRYHPLVYCC